MKAALERPVNRITFEIDEAGYRWVLWRDNDPTNGRVSQIRRELVEDWQARMG